MNAKIAEWVTPQSEFTRAIGKDKIEAEFAANIGRWQFDRPIKMDGDEWRVDARVFWAADFYNAEWDSGFGAVLPCVFVDDELRQVVVSATAQYDRTELVHVPFEWKSPAVMGKMTDMDMYAICKVAALPRI